jgi:DNA mismatch endonuclease (patch repair protein)
MDDRTPQQRSENMSAVRGKNTAPERLVRSTLHRLGFRCRLHRKDLPGTPDIVFPGRRSMMFIHGCFWHGHKCRRGSLPSSNTEFWQRKIAGNCARDGRTKKELRHQGWLVMTVWECETKDKGKLEKRLSRFLEQGVSDDRRLFLR